MCQSEVVMWVAHTLDVDHVKVRRFTQHRHGLSTVDKHKSPMWTNLGFRQSQVCKKLNFNVCFNFNLLFCIVYFSIFLFFIS